MATKDIEVRRNNIGSRNVTPYDPIAQMDRWMNNFFSDPFGSLLSEMPRLQRQASTQLDETEDSYILSAELPGISKDDVNISVNGNVLTIRAEHSEEEDKEQTYRRQYRSFDQSLALPSTVDVDHIEARCENGLLEIMLPKTEQAKARTIEVQAGKGGFLGKLKGKTGLDKKASDASEEKKH